MKICGRGIQFLQIINNRGDVRICGWLQNGGEVIGSLSEKSLYDIYHGERMNQIVTQLSSGDYSYCDIDACHLLANGQVDQQLVEMEALPEYPEALYLAFEQTCNYRCSCCSMHRVLENQIKNTVDIEKDYKMIEERIADVLPHLKLISANGLGELFASKHTMNILANWKPISPKEEITVQLETNGSLFNRKNWDKISNLGEYNLQVSVTVMSFDETTYQVLSGTSLPVENIKENLKFISELRQKGIINYFELATVYQDRNFRTLPQFVEEALKYKPDYIRLRAFAPWGNLDREIEWFSDVRGKYHPYHQEFLEIMKHPILKNPIVHDWSGGRESTVNNFPISEIRKWTQAKSDILRELIINDEFIGKIIEMIGNKTVSVYGCGDVGKAVVHVLKSRVKINAILDRGIDGVFDGVCIVKPYMADERIKSGVVLQTVTYDRERIIQYLRNLNYNGEIIDVRDMVCC